MINNEKRICGKWCRDLVRHITKHHKIEARTYKKMLGLDLSESLMSESTKSKLRKAVVENGTINNLSQGKAFRLKKGEVRIQNYKRSEQTVSRLKNLTRKNEKKNFLVNDLLNSYNIKN
jgi:poly-gamma-glutamate capsule biosynthesis protein CapA/YwtB (metallophosphatase superfamily)